MNRSALTQLRVVELRERCEELGLTYEGLNKNELIDILIENEMEEEVAPSMPHGEQPAAGATAQPTAQNAVIDLEQERMQYKQLLLQEQLLFCQQQLPMQPAALGAQLLPPMLAGGRRGGKDNERRRCR